jgi:polar amino acid transport system substrate-binding protein
MNLKKIIKICLLVNLFIPACFSLEVLTFASLEDLPPKIYKEDGVLKGTYVDIISAVCERMNYKAEFISYPWARVLIVAQNGSVDAIFPPLKSAEREEFLIFPSEPVSYTRNVIFSRKNSNLNIKQLSDLKGLMVGVNDRYSYGQIFDDFKKNLNLDLSRTEDMQISKLAESSAKRMDVAAGSEEVFLFLMKKRGLRDNFKILYTISESPSYVAFSKARGVKAKDLANKFSKAFLELKKEGVIAKINKKYFN